MTSIYMMNCQNWIQCGRAIGKNPSRIHSLPRNVPTVCRFCVTLHSSRDFVLQPLYSDSESETLIGPPTGTGYRGPKLLLLPGRPRIVGPKELPVTEDVMRYRLLPSFSGFVPPRSWILFWTSPFPGDFVTMSHTFIWRTSGTILRVIITPLEQPETTKRKHRSMYTTTK